MNIKLTGTLIKDVVLRFTPRGKPVAELTVSMYTGGSKEHGYKKPVEYATTTKNMKRGLGIDENKPKSSCDLIEVMKILLKQQLKQLSEVLKPESLEMERYLLQIWKDASGLEQKKKVKKR